MMPLLGSGPSNLHAVSESRAHRRVAVNCRQKEGSRPPPRTRSRARAIAVNARLGSGIAGQDASVRFGNRTFRKGGFCA